MKKVKKSAVLLLVLIYVSLLFGCDNMSTPTVNQSVTPGTSNQNTFLPEGSTGPTIPHNDFSEHFVLETAPDADVAVTVQYLPETVDNPENLPVLKWVCAVPAHYAGQIWRDSAIRELNQMLFDRGLPFRIQLALVKMDTYEWYNSRFWLSLPDVQEIISDADLIYGAFGPTERQAYLMPITEYATGSVAPSLEHAVVHELNWTTGSAGSDIYGIPAYSILPSCNGWRVNPEILTKYGLTENDFNHDFWEMDDIFEKIYEKNGNQPFLYIEENDGGIIGGNYSNIKSITPYVTYNVVKYAYQYIGACFGIDFSADTPVVVNTLETDTFRKTRDAVIRYREAGYVTASTKDVSAFELAQVYYSSVVGATVFTASDGLVHIPVTDVVFDNSYSSHFMSGVAANSQHKEESLSFLNLISENESFRIQLLFGKEGRDYMVEDGVMSTIFGKDGAMYDMQFISMLSSYGDLCDEMETGYPTHSGKNKLQTYLDCMDSVKLPYYPISFDYTGYEQELQAMGVLLGEFYDTYSELTEDQYDLMLSRLKDAGSEKIRTKLQQQLDAWIAENPQWQ